MGAFEDAYGQLTMVKENDLSAQDQFLEAIRSNDSDTVRRLLDAGADPNDLNEFGWTPLMIAAWENAPASAQAIAEAGGDPNEIVYDDGGEKTAYRMAVQRQHSKMISWLEQITDAELVQKAQRQFAPPNARRQSELDFCAAINDGLLGRAKELLEAGVDPDCRDESGVPALLHAAKVSYPITKLLIEYGADPNIRFSLQYIERGAARGSKPVTIPGANALHHCMSTADDRTISLLVEAGVDVNAVDGFDEITVLMEAVIAGRPHAIRLLVTHGADVTARSRQGQTAVEYRTDRCSTRKERDEVLRELGLLTGGADAYLTGEINDLDSLKAAANEFDFNATDDQKRSCLYTAIIRQQAEIALWFIDSGADVNQIVGHDSDFDSTWAGVIRSCAKCDTGFTSSTDTASCPQCGTPSTLSQRADPDAADFDPALLRFVEAGVNSCFHPYEMWPINAAARLGQATVVRELRAAGAMVNTRVRKGCLMAAVWFDHRKTARVLLESVVDLDYEHHWSGETAASLAAMRGDAELVAMLCVRGAKCRFDRSELTAVTCAGAAEVGDIASLERLNAEGAKLNSVSPHNGLTPLCASAMFGQIETTRWLLLRGVDVTKKSEQGKSPVQLAKEFNNGEIAALLT